ncbi:hypothetical protein [Sphingomonas phyllosphaerae]|uniref:hypothetical protein n=1 Tax=Sphingomonas phyllosphaerae TaxID=257003 RepID=UPI00041B55ED|nr:hypothetical protein [Sphingomonas phyllosphaerae]
MHHTLHDTLPTASVALLNYVLAELGPDDPYTFAGNTGLPAGVECLEHNLIVIATPISERLFDHTLMRCAKARKRDIVLVRHGFHPEVLEPVRADVALHSVTGPILVPDLAFYRDAASGLHLVPAHADLFVQVRTRGLEVSIPAPWNSVGERMAGLERAAAEIVSACRRPEQG